MLVSRAIALLEYCLAVPANRLGYGPFNGFQLKIMQEAIPLTVFIVFVTTCLPGAAGVEMPDRVAIGRRMIRGMAALHISEAELARDLHAVLEQVRLG